MRITTWNVNGLRAAIKKGLSEALDVLKPDVLLLQEIRVKPEQLDPAWQNPEGWHVTWHPAQRPGYAGTAVWSRKPHKVLETGLSHDGQDEDEEGRAIRVQVDGVQAASIYLPSGSSGTDKQVKKEAWMTEFRAWCDTRRKLRTPLILGGDLNIAIEDQDLYYAKSNQKQSGFLPHERQFMRDLVASGWHDTLREHVGDCQGDDKGPFTWWSNRGQARALDRGWRIDYLLANKKAHAQIQNVQVDRELSLTISDHAPLSIDLTPGS